MDNKFIITRKRALLRPGDFFAFVCNSPFIRRFDFSTGTESYFTTIRSYNKDVSDRSSISSVHLYGFICKPR